MKYLFGPVLSRRIGLSLGVDIVPYKYCSLDCVYCEAGRTTNLSTIRKELVDTDAVISELEQYLSKTPKLDYITFSGNGEPTLHLGLEKITNYLATNFPQYKLCLITNSTSYLEPKVDLIMPSLDAVSQDVFESINHPAPGIKSLEIVESLIKFKRIYKGIMWLEIFFVSGLNDTLSELTKLKEAIIRIKPDKIQLNSLDRPAAKDWVKAISQKRLLWIKEFFSPLPVEIIAKALPSGEYEKISENLNNSIVDIVKRRPCTIKELTRILNENSHNMSKQITHLIDMNILEKVKEKRGHFIKIKSF